jgi:hypothetical protein
LAELLVAVTSASEIRVVDCAVVFNVATEKATPPPDWYARLSDNTSELAEKFRLVVTGAVTATYTPPPFPLAKFPMAVTLSSSTCASETLLPKLNTENVMEAPPPMLSPA